MREKLWMLTIALLTATALWAQGYKTVCDISYTAKAERYSQERLKLDVYNPQGPTAYAGRPGVGGRPFGVVDVQFQTFLRIAVGLRRIADIAHGLVALCP